MKQFPILSILAIIAIILCVSGTASANPVNMDPAGAVQSYTFFFIAAGTIALETMLLCLFSRVFHDSDCDLAMKVSFVVLNIITLLIVLMPLQRLTNSILIAELGVVIVESIAILKIYQFNNLKITTQQAIIYSCIVNFVSYSIGALCQ